MVFLFSGLSFILSGCVCFSFTPLALMILLVTQSVLLGMMMVVVGKAQIWFSYVLVIVFLGGMMVIFIYTMSLAPKEIMEDLSFYTRSGVVGLSFLILVSIMWYFYPCLSTLMDSDTSEQFVVMMFSSVSSKVYLYCVMNLLFALLCVSKMVDSSKGPLRLG
uniref:NADH dehydrogenase subunit 6 n=1 Tax=Pleurocryptella fimbriata TaxID=2480055 RepID=A0A8K1Y3K7_9CRUS|nr:NADH dehydrogenase subunit 6 [Pleurocryptella fimbriata]